MKPIKPEVKKKQLCKDTKPELINECNPYALIRLDKNEVDDNIVCDVCLDSDDDEDDEIVICDLCLVGVH